MDADAVSLRDLSFRYRARLALDSVSLCVTAGEVFGLLGPNGGGKTTLFRILTTALPIQQGSATILGLDAATDPFGVRRRIGVVFQSPSLDRKLTVHENLKHQARLYGLTQPELRRRIDEMLERLGLASRRHDLVETLSGGLARRVELAKGMLHQPELLILDEPSTGLDPGARRDLWHYLRSLAEQRVTVLVTTHLMEEAERCDRVAILDQGRLVALGTPESLRREIGGDVVMIRAPQPDALARRLEESLQIRAEVIDGVVRFEHVRGYEVLPRIAEAAEQEIESISIAKPTLEDVFVRKTGHRFWSETARA